MKESFLEILTKRSQTFYKPINVHSVVYAIRNGKIVWNQGPYCWYFRVDVKHLQWPYREYIKTAKNGGFCEELHSENDFEAVLAAFCCYDYGADASEAVQKIARDHKDYHKCSSCVIVCWIAKIYQSIAVKKGWLLTYQDSSSVAKKSAEVAQKKEQ